MCSLQFGMHEHGETLSEGEVRTIARLARLSPSDAQVGALGRELTDMLAMARALTEADLEGAEPMAGVMEATNRLGDDEPGATLTAEQIRALAPSVHEDGSIRVPRVLGESAGG